MKFDKEKIFTVLNANEVRIGSSGYFADNLMKRFNVNVPPYAMPLIWVKTKGADKKYLIVRFASALTICHNVEVYTPTLEDLVEGYTYLDGSPCGIEEDEE